MSSAEFAIDLVPAEYRAQEWLRRRLRFWTLATVLGAFAMGLVAFSLNVRTQALEQSVQPLRESLVSMQSWGAMLEPLASKLDMARSRQLVVNDLLHEPYWSEMLLDLSQATTENIWLQDLRLSKDVVVENETESERFNLTLTGIATSNQEVIRFMTELLQSQHIGTLKLESSRVRQDHPSMPCVDFNLRGSLLWQ